MPYVQTAKQNQTLCYECAFLSLRRYVKRCALLCFAFALFSSLCGCCCARVCAFFILLYLGFKEFLCLLKRQQAYLCRDIYQIHNILSNTSSVYYYYLRYYKSSLFSPYLDINIFLFCRSILRLSVCHSFIPDYLYNGVHGHKQ